MSNVAITLHGVVSIEVEENIYHSESKTSAWKCVRLTVTQRNNEKVRFDCFTDDLDLVIGDTVTNYKD